MKAAFIRGHGGPELLEVGEQPEPRIGPYDLKVAVKAASINPIDWKIRNGLLKIMMRYPMPLILGQDLSGTVTAVGAKVARFKPGDDIFARLDKASIGALAEIAAVRETDAALKPPNLSHVEAASIPLVGLTAWQVLRDHMGLNPGQTVLIHAGSGGVGTIAIQLARTLGARVFTTASARNAPMLQRLGAERVIDYRSERFDDALKDVDAVFDTQGGETLLRSIAITRPGGCVVTIGGIPTARVMREWDLAPWKQWLAAFMNRKATALAARRKVRFDYHFMSPSGAQLAALARLLEDRKIVPVIDRVFALDDAREAFAHAEAGHAVGKVVIAVAP
ncbi:MAG TPA: NADP-dependent oxidoreductase [Usitatibacteraceae bacterium]|nr:NADP-dependent oxidoreductase [Usitatibacteraceae bacterium]